MRCANREFLIVSGILFFVVQGMNRLMKGDIRLEFVAASSRSGCRNVAIAEY
jgi:hypothetical protein